VFHRARQQRAGARLAADCSQYCEAARTLKHTYRSISDPQKHAAYSKLAVPAVTPFGARILAFGNAAVAVEHGLKERRVVVEYPTVRAGINYKFNWGPRLQQLGIREWRLPSARRFPLPWTVDKPKPGSWSVSETLC
jgi:hypothetical protein